MFDNEFGDFNERETTFKSLAARFIFLLFSAVIVVISAITSFSFFFTYFGSIIPNTVLDSLSRSLISGLIGTLLFDVACVIWLLTFLHHSETKQQRAVSIVMTGITFIGAAAASVAYLSLSGQEGLVELDATTRNTIGMISLVVVVFGIVANFAAAQMHNGFSLESRQAMQAADLRDLMLDNQERQARKLNRLVAENLDKEFAGIAPSIAKEKASTLAALIYGKQEEVPEQILAMGKDSEVDSPQLIVLSDEDGEESPN